MALSQIIHFCVIEWLIAVLFIAEFIILLKFKFKKWLKFNLALVIAIFIILSFTTTPYYHTKTFSEQTSLEIRESTKDELYLLCQDLIEKTNNTYTSKTNSFYDNAIISNNSFNKLNNEYSFIKQVKSVPKPVFHSVVMSKWNVTGFFSAFTLESIINKDITPVEIPFTMCHELSHIANFLREDEANFIGYLACKASDDLFFNYSGYYNAMIYATNAYYHVDPQNYFELINRLSDDVKYDIYNQSLFWSKYKNTQSSKTYEKIDDTFLKVNSVYDGTMSYGRMVDLLLAEYRLENNKK